MREIDNKNEKKKRNKERHPQQWIRTDVKPDKQHVMIDENNPVWNILILLMILYLVFRLMQIHASAMETDGFLPGGAWELDTGKEIWVDELFYNALEDSEDETIHAEGAGIEEYSFEASYDPRDYGLVKEV